MTEHEFAPRCCGVLLIFIRASGTHPTQQIVAFATSSATTGDSCVRSTLSSLTQPQSVLSLWSTRLSLRTNRLSNFSYHVCFDYCSLWISTQNVAISHLDFIVTIVATQHYVTLNKIHMKPTKCKEGGAKTWPIYSLHTNASSSTRPMECHETPRISTVNFIH